MPKHRLTQDWRSFTVIQRVQTIPVLRLAPQTRIASHSRLLCNRAMASGQIQILVVDDDPLLCGFLARFLTKEGFQIVVAHNGRDMRRALADTQFDLVFLDLTFPSGEDGISFAHSVRTQYDLPMIMLSGKDSMTDKVVCLEIGADDYITKPFEPRELLARVRAVLRRFGKRASRSEDAELDASDAVTFCGWRLDLSAQRLLAPDGHDSNLTGREFQVMAALVSRPGRVLSRDQILEIVAHRNWVPDDRSIDVMIANIRRKMTENAECPNVIKTIRGLGYMFKPPSAAVSVMSAENKD
jgi:two-component system, OmpR family, response regulator